LSSGCEETLLANGVIPENISHFTVPGSYELPFAAKSIIMRAKQNAVSLDAVVAIGCVIKGETSHYEYICSCASSGIASVALETGYFAVRVIFSS
jgi:6,7-dimethyl-8-ribityllumazine synthase